MYHEAFRDLLRLPAGIIGLLTFLYSGTESAAKCGGDVSSFFPGHTRVRQECVLAPSFFNICLDWVLDRVVDQSHCRTSVSKITDLVFVYDTVIFTESLEVLVMALETLHDEPKPLGFQVSRPKNKVQGFGSLLDETAHSIHNNNNNNYNNNNFYCHEHT